MAISDAIDGHPPPANLGTWCDAAANYQTQTASGLGGYAGDTALLKLFQRQSRHPSTGGSCWPAAWSSHNAMHSGQRLSQPASSGKRFAQPSPTQIVNSSSTTLIRHHPTSTARALRYPQCGSRHQINGPATPSERPWSGDARGPAVHRRRQTHPFPWFPYHHGQRRSGL